MKLHAYLSALVCFTMINSTFGQESFHRTYPFISPVSQSLCGDAIQLSGGQYVSVDFLVDVDGQTQSSDTLIVNIFKPKGDIESTKKIFIDSTKFGRLFLGSKPSLTQTKDGGLHISFETQNDTKFTKHILKYKADSKLAITSLSTESDKNDGPGGITTLLPSYTNNLYAIYGAGDNIDNTEICINKRPLNPTQPGLTRMLRATDSNGDDIVSEATDVAVNDKINRIALTGILDSVNNEPFLLVVDSTAKVVLSKKYFDVQNANSILVITNIAMTKDTGYVLAGYSIIITPQFEIIAKGVIFKTNKIGDVIWGKVLSFSDESVDLIKGLTIDNSNNIVFGCMSINFNEGLLIPFAVQLDQNGTEKQKKQYTRVPVNPDLQGNIFKTAAGGTAWLSTGLDSSAKAVLQFLKLDDELKTSCEEVIDQEILFNNEFAADTVIWKSRIDSMITKVDSVKTFANAYDVPVLALEVRPFCPEEPINWLFQATTGGSTNYKWSTGVEGPQHDTLRVFEEGKYSVTVTVNKDVCYMMCDTAELARYDKPKVSLEVSLGTFCATDKLRITATYTPGHPVVSSYSWNTGESTKFIDVATPGEYTVTIVDQCGEVATAKINTGSFPQKITMASITPQINVNCLTGTLTGKLTASGNSSENLLGVERFKWSDPSGSTTKTIDISQGSPINVMVTVTDGCGGTATASYMQGFSGPGIKDSDISILADISTFCANNTLRLNAFVNEISNSAKYKWSNGTTTAFTEVSEPGTYTVTVTDICGNTATATKVTGEFPKKISSVTISSDLEDVNCEGILGTVTAKGNSTVTGPYGLGVERYLWSVGGETTNTLEIDQNFKVSVTVTITDGCGNTSSATFSRNVIGPDNNENVGDLSYAHVFFPDGVHVFGNIDTTAAFRDTVQNHKLNRTFGPINLDDNSCLEKITDYEFYVFNRWGQQVFESKNVKDEWNGLKDETRWPSDTYVWVVRYKIFGIEKKLKGDVTMIR
jgi:CHU_C Type IX secretion signal domain